MSIFEAAIRVVAPPQCIGCGQEGDSLCTACSSAEILPHGERCWNCGSISAGSRTCPKCRRLGGPGFVWICTDYSGLAKELVTTYKFNHQRIAADAIARLMGGTFHERFDNELINRRSYVIVPVPTATSRVRERGFDHALLLAKAIARETGQDYSPLLGRTGQSRQVGAGRKERLARPTKDYYLRLSYAATGRNILLIDDVLTTGGTLVAATKVLRAAGAKRVDALVFAKRL